MSNPLNPHDYPDMIGTPGFPPFEAQKQGSAAQGRIMLQADSKGAVEVDGKGVYGSWLAVQIDPTSGIIVYTPSPKDPGQTEGVPASQTIVFNCVDDEETFQVRIDLMGEAIQTFADAFANQVD